MAEKKAKKKPGAPRKRRKLAGKSIGLEARELLTTATPSDVGELQEAIEEDGGRVLASYREPFGGHWLIMAALPIEKLEPVIAKLGRFLDPVIIVRKESKDSETRYWTPNGNHRLSAMRTLGAKSIVGIVLPEASAAYQNLALNTEKAHNLRERALEVIKMYHELATLDDATEETYALEFEEAALITLGLCYLERPRFSGGAYHPILRRADEFLKKPLQAALGIRQERAKTVMELD